MRLLTARETASLLRISLSGVSRLHREKKIRAVKIGRRLLFDEADLESFVDRSKSPCRVPRI